MPGNTLSRFAPGLRQSAESKGRGWTQLLKGIQPAAGASYTRVIPADYWERPLAVAFTLTTSAAAAQRTLALNFTDGDGNIWNQTVIAGNVGPSATVTEYGDQAWTPFDQPIQTVTGEGSVTSPALGATIASVAAASMPAGEYIVSVVVNLAGTLVQAADANNLEITIGTTTIVLDNEIAAGDQYFGPFVVDAPGGSALAVKAIAAGTAGSIYGAFISVQPAAQQTGFTFPDFVLKSGWQMQVIVGNIQAADQVSAVYLMLERYPSSGQYLPGRDAAEELAELILAAVQG